MFRFIVLALLAVLVATGADARGRGGGHGSHVHVSGYYTSRGTYVQPHYRSAPNGTTLDNWSTRGNVNPYTGRVGTKDPYGGSTNGYGTHTTEEPVYQQSQPSSPSPGIEGYVFRQRYETNLSACLRNGPGCDMDIVYNEDIARVRAARARYAAIGTLPRVTSGGIAFKARYESNLKTCLGGWADCDMDLVYNEDIQKVRDARWRMGMAQP